LRCGLACTALLALRHSWRTARGGQAKYRSEGIADCLLTITASAEDNAKGLAYFQENKDMILKHMSENGAVIFKNFDMSKNPEGFRRVWETLGLAPCLDPIHSSGLRSFLSARDGVYEEVNKKSLAKHYIGLHNESTFKKTATYGAFVCFSPATVSGGEFFIADGAKIFRDLKTEVVQDLYTRGVRISVSNLDLGFLKALGPMKDNAMDFFKNLVGSTVAPKFDMDLDMIYGTDGNPERLQAIEHRQSPINRHPISGKPVWFCNIHNHARYLRDRRPCSVPEVGMTDVYYGDLSKIDGATLDHINDVSNKHIQNLEMGPGDVLLIDNYRMLHGCLNTLPPHPSNLQVVLCFGFAAILVHARVEVCATVVSAKTETTLVMAAGRRSRVTACTLCRGSARATRRLTSCPTLTRSTPSSTSSSSEECLRRPAESDHDPHVENKALAFNMT